jgi:hypothetical protein
VPAADDGFVALARILCAAPAVEDEPVAVEVASAAPEADLARDVRLLTARVADAEALLADVLERLR